jgi:protein TonB
VVGEFLVVVRFVKSSGSSVLDKKALALVQRAEPLPPPPPEIPGAQIPLSQQINYNR